MSFALLNPIENPNDFNIITVAGKDSPGIAKLGKVSRGWQWDVKVGRGLFGSTTTFVGRVPAKFSCSFELWKKIHFIEWEEFYNKLRYDPTKIRFNPETLWTSGVNAVDIFHPYLAQIDINSVVIESLSPPEHRGKGVHVASIDFLEWFPPPRLSVVATPAGSTDVQGVELSSENAAQRAKIAKLQLEIDSKTAFDSARSGLFRR